MPTLVGDATNMAAQLCRRARAGEVLLSAAAYPSHRAPAAEPNADPMPLKLLPKLQLRGRTTPTDVWCVALPERLAMRHTHPAQDAGH
jgi:class 3 adenylate cyclase